MNRGMVHIYTGDGKGKTSACFGMACRALGAGLRVCIIQFMKHEDSSEVKLLRKLYPRIKIRLFGAKRKVCAKITRQDRKLAQEGILHIKKIFESNKFDMVILDEIIVALSCGVVSLAEVNSLLSKKPLKLELILSGRNAPIGLIKQADLVTEMRAVKHYMKRGVYARLGIER